jgi:hypothetical protein
VGTRIPKRQKINTEWYDDLVLLYQKTKGLGLKEVSSSLRNIGWENLRGFIHGKVHEHIRTKRLQYDRDLCQKLFQESFFIFCKVIDIWDPSRKTKVMTWLGDCLPQELMNNVRLTQYHKSRDRKIASRLRNQVVDESATFDNEEDQERKSVLEEVHDLLENLTFNTDLERKIAFTMIYGRAGDWRRLQKSSGLGAGKFGKVRKQVVEKLRSYIMDNCSIRAKEILTDLVLEK